MKYIFLFLPFLSMQSFGQSSDTLNGFENKINGEEINYFSHMHHFAKTALLTRANGSMPITWEAPLYKGKEDMVTYELLMGHSTGTSGADRKFDVMMNGKTLFTIITKMKEKGSYTLSDKSKDGSSYYFIQQEYDINGDAFGKLYITIPSVMVRKEANFTISGQNEGSRDWLMIFMYQRGLKVIVEPTNLVTRMENKRQLNLFIDNPFADSSSLNVKTKDGASLFSLHHGYNKISFPAYLRKTLGSDTIRLVVNQTDTLFEAIALQPIRDYTFCIIHHSHNDIGYSHLQPEVEKIQNNNIVTALNWIEQNKNASEQPIWHIESLWAVENFLKIASAKETASFVEAVKNGQIVLSANYANILTGLCQAEELNWTIEYAKQLETKYGFTIQNAMITDIPGITYSGLLSYVNNHIPYLSIGPNYVEALPDKGDRVGSVIKEQGDKLFYWKATKSSTEKLLVWTAGKGYSFFHGIGDGVKEASWEQRISNYCEELQAEHYPYNIVQLRYTKNSDNGPVDTTLSAFVENWNQHYLVPQLKISSVNALFVDVERRYGKTIPTVTGEISPYWEDGAYSTAHEEIQIRELVRKVMALESFAKQKNKYLSNQSLFYRLHRSIVMFHEHTWGAWCSISDPELPFTTQQWEIKKQFLDSALFYYNQLISKLSFTYKQPLSKLPSNHIAITDFTVDPLHGGLSTIMVDGQNIVSTITSKFFEMIYVAGINPSKWIRADKVTIKVIQDDAAKKIIRISANIPSMKNLSMQYSLLKQEGKLLCAVSFDKKTEKEKESLHMAMPFAMHHPALWYGNENKQLDYNNDQLPGSNHEFVCVEDIVTLRSDKLTATIRCPNIALYEVGGIIDEHKTNGVKTWKPSSNNTADIFLYVFNNYWHTNFKASQEGHIAFETELSFEKK